MVYYPRQNISEVNKGDKEKAVIKVNIFHAYLSLQNVCGKCTL